MQWHVCSLIVQINPALIASIESQLLTQPGLEISASNPQQSKLIVVIESADSDTLYQQIESIRDIAGVLAVSLVYHQQDEVSA